LTGLFGGGQLSFFQILPHFRGIHLGNIFGYLFFDLAESLYRIKGFCRLFDFILRFHH
jgi:hypothetical protein